MAFRHFGILGPVSSLQFLDQLPRSDSNRDLRASFRSSNDCTAFYQLSYAGIRLVKVMNPTAKAGGLSLYYAAMFCSGSETIGAMTNALARMFRAAFSSA